MYGSILFLKSSKPNGQKIAAKGSPENQPNQFAAAGEC
jgi:hypothetical protein